MEIHIRFDWAIKRLLRQKSNFGILEGFLSELLKQDIKIQEILESESNRQHERDKSNRVDILVKSDSDELMLIEIQNEREHDYFHRMNYGQAKLVTEHTFKGDSYDTIKKVFSINIVYFDLGQGEDYLYTGRTQFKGVHKNDILKLSEKQQKKYTNIKSVPDIFTTYYLIKVNNFDNVAVNTLDEWIYFLKNNKIKKEFKAKGLQEANEKMRIDNLERADKWDYEAFMKEQRIRMAEIDTAKFDAEIDAQEAKEEVEKFRKQAEDFRKQAEDSRKQAEDSKKQVENSRKQAEHTQFKFEQERYKLVMSIKNMFADGLSIETISKYTGQDEDFVRNCLSGL